MTITIRTEEDDQRQLKLTVEVSEDRVEEAMRQRARKLANDIRMPGFRRGKAPYNVVLQRFGRDLIRAEAIEDMVPNIFDEAVSEADVAAYGRPSLEDLDVEPLVMTFTVPLEPQVTLGDYRALRKEVEPVSVSEEAVEQALEQVQINHQQIESVERAAELGDVITIAGKGVLIPEAADDTEGEDVAEGDADDVPKIDRTTERILFDEESIDLLMDSEKVFHGTPFVDNLVGKTTGEQVAFSITFPDDFEDEEVAGRTADVEISVLDVKSRDLPAIDDELAKLEGNFESLEELRESLRTRLKDEAEAQAKDELIEGMVDDMLEEAQIIYPPAAVEMEIDDAVESFKSQVTRSGWDFDDYMKLQGLTDESLREDFRESAEDRLRRRLVMRQFVLDEKLRIKAEDVEALVDERISRYDNEELRNSVRDFYLSGSGFDMISSEVLSDKVYQRIADIFSGAAPSLEELALAETVAVEALEEE